MADGTRRFSQYQLQPLLKELPLHGASYSGLQYQPVEIQMTHLTFRSIRFGQSPLDLYRWKVMSQHRWSRNGCYYGNCGKRLKRRIEQSHDKSCGFTTLHSFLKLTILIVNL